jgi:AdoMet-dependent rRNA methyltransferase SPB1
LGGDDDDESAAASLDPKVAAKLAAKRELIRRGMGAISGSAATETGAASAGFDIVPAAADHGEADTGSSDDSDSEADADAGADADDGPDPRLEDYDSDTHAEMLALGKLLRRHTTAKALVDASYNRYAFEDGPLPPWFAADEGKHFKPQLPISRAEVEEVKARFRDIAARPIAKVAEARARKKRRLLTRMERVKKQAQSILESEEMGEAGELHVHCIFFPAINHALWVQATHAPASAPSPSCTPLPRPASAATLPMPCRRTASARRWWGAPARAVASKTWTPA